MTTDLRAMAQESCFVASLALASSQIDLAAAALDDAVAALRLRADGPNRIAPGISARLQAGQNITWPRSLSSSPTALAMMELQDLEEGRALGISVTSAAVLVAGAGFEPAMGGYEPPALDLWASPQNVTATAP